MKDHTKVPVCSFRSKLRKLVETAIDIELEIKLIHHPIVIR